MAKSYILLACDGTGSKNWRSAEGTNSHVFQFFHRFKDGARGYDGKKYFDGPSVPVFGALGFGTFNRVQDGMDFILSGATKFCKNEGLFGLDTNFVNKNLGLCLVGHSRGGVVCLDVAHKLANLGYEVLFLGLLDAVKMTAVSYETRVPKNVRNVFNAVRDQNFYSRYTWGNAGTEYEDGSPVLTRKYKTPHGGLGGDPNFTFKKGISDDVAFTDAFQMGEANSIITPGSIGELSRQQNLNRLHRLGVRLEKDNEGPLPPLPTLREMGHFESIRVFEDLIRAAQESGVPV